MRSIRPERKARSVNSPGWACRAPRRRQSASTRFTSGGEPDRVDLGDVLAGVGSRRRPEGDHRRQPRAAGRRAGVRPGGSRRGGAGGPSASALKSVQGDRPGSGPESRTSPRSPGPGGLATAAIVSVGSSIVARSGSAAAWPGLIDSRRPGRLPLISCLAGLGACRDRGDRRGLACGPSRPCRLARRPSCDRSGLCGPHRGSSP